MNNEFVLTVQPVYVTFEQAKKLKEKGFNEKCSTLYNERGEGSGTKMGMDFLPNNYNNYYSRPEQWQVVKWLSVNHGIWVYTYPVTPFVSEDEEYPKTVWISKVCSLNQVNFEKYIDADNGLAINHHRSSEDAYSAAFDYLLNDLI